MTGRAALAVACLLASGPAYAQVPPDRPAGRVEVEVGGGLLGGTTLGAEDASLRANDPTERPYRLFAADSRFGSAGSLHARVGVGLTRRIGVEGGVTFSRPELRTSLSDDAEGAPAVTIVEQIDQYVIDASLVVMVEEWRIGGLVPFFAGGAGYLRQLHEGLTVIEQGAIYHVGGGVKQWLLARDQGFLRSAGLRADARVYVPTGGIAFGDGPKPRGALTASVFLGF